MLASSPVVDIIHSQSNMFGTSVTIKAIQCLGRKIPGRRDTTDRILLYPVLEDSYKRSLFRLNNVLNN